MKIKSKLLKYLEQFALYEVSKILPLEED